jgi:hypothetical protein
MKPTSDLSNKTKAELTALARRNKIKVASGILKDELIKTIKKGLRKIEANKKSKATQNTPRKKSSKAPKAKTLRKPKSTARKTTAAKRTKTPVKKTAHKKSPVKRKKIKTPAKKSATRTRSAPAKADLPERYGDHRLVALARDPNWAYVYWDLNHTRVRDLLKSANQTADKARWVLRVYSIALPAEDKGAFFDINIDVKTGSYYLDLSRPGARFIVEIGVIDASGIFRTTAQSNPIILPVDRPSETTAPEGMAPSEAPDLPGRS